ncbi:hypothetical protein F2S72_09245 [Pseudomonas syringae pv. actinidiae]|nr:hypothetical protein [Pseudomonas syringae pv. actinidiae]
MTDLIAITRPHLKAFIEASLAEEATPADAAFIATAVRELAYPSPTSSPTSQEVRESFELACKSSTAYRFPLGPVTINGVFQHYMDTDTDSAFVGYRAGVVRGLKWHQQCAQANSRTGALEEASSNPLSALKALQACSWLEPDPSDSQELAEAKAQALKAIGAGNQGALTRG